MTILYGEFTIIHNEDILSNLFTLFNIEYKPKKETPVIILFQDGEICEIDYKLKDFKYNFLDSTRFSTPSYFNKNLINDKRRYFCEDKNLDYDDLFKNFTKYSKHNTISSCFNCIYFFYHGSTVKIKETNYHLNSKLEGFGIVRLKSSETKPRFLFAYDSEEFNKEEVVYLINYILKNKIDN